MHLKIWRQLETGQRWRTMGEEQVRIISTQGRDVVFQVYDPRLNVPTDQALRGGYFEVRDLLEQARAYLEI